MTDNELKAVVENQLTLTWECREFFRRRQNRP